MSEPVLFEIELSRASMPAYLAFRTLIPFPSCLISDNNYIPASINGAKYMTMWLTKNYVTLSEEADFAESVLDCLFRFCFELCVFMFLIGVDCDRIDSESAVLMSSASSEKISSGWSTLNSFVAADSNGMISLLMFSFATCKKRFQNRFHLR